MTSVNGQETVRADFLASQARGLRPQRVELATITKAPEFQVRKKTDAVTVNRYAEVIKAGGEFPPVRLARVRVSEDVTEPVLVPVDGFHRIAAHEKLGLETIEATVENMDPVLAQWKAAEANMSHGLQLTSKELREAFRRFIRAKQHVKGKYRSVNLGEPRGKLKLMSYRDIGAKMGKSYGTIRNWMREDFPKVYAQMGGDEWRGGKPNVSDEFTEGKDKADPVSLLQAALAAYQTTTNPQVRGEAVYLVEQIAERMKKAGGWVDMTPEEVDF